MSAAPTPTTSQTLTGAQALALTLDTSVSAGGVGAAGASLKLVQLTQGAKTWLGVDASGITLSLTLDPLTLAITNGELKLNRATGSGATQARLEDAHARPHRDRPSRRSTSTATLDLHISGTATVALGGLFTATGTGSLDVGQWTGTDATTGQTLTDAQALVLTLDTSASAGGVGSAGREPAPRLAHPGREELARRRRLRDQPLADARPAHLSASRTAS